MSRVQPSLPHFAEHFSQLREKYDRLLIAKDIDVLAIHAGQLKRHFMDDSEYAFRVSPHFKAICPLLQSTNSWVLMRPEQKPTLVLFASDDFWHEAPYIDQQDWLSMFHVELISTPDAVDKYLPYDKSRTVYLGEHIEVAQALGILEVNPEAVLSYLHYARLFKSDYEIACIEQANRIAALGHEAAEAAFFSQASEFDCWLAYMAATRQGPEEMPYNAIIGFNEHAATLHYRGKQTFAPPTVHSMLIDAGAQVRGYAADISRTYAFEDDEFAAMVKSVDSLLLDLTAQIRPNRTYVWLHEQTLLGIADILKRFDIVRMDVDGMISRKIVDKFMPHGFGHMLGLQVHDTGGSLPDASGKMIVPPARYANLKTTRKIEPRQVVTLEPGLYFIDSLMQQLANGPDAKAINWAKLDELRNFGGIRIEDNLLITEQGARNLTREQGLA
ncbi:Xaa-Pro dipeptidase [Aliidiomarina soli]|uniref:Xaa-Pro dipeptidase n=1 Tax=Aliidiomarina soli TaxID=1928574 RepID=A0A432WJ33_9GAMM|nr:Xaa-Pro dipeptidase [Aliidiomarina soli]RUO33679.1 Xaa-Pro dipeptidase [Aliidiomarina soli]